MDVLSPPYRVGAAPAGGSASEILHAEPVDLIIPDLRLGPKETVWNYSLVRAS